MWVMAGSIRRVMAVNGKVSGKNANRVGRGGPQCGSAQGSRVYPSGRSGKGG